MNWNGSVLQTEDEAKVLAHQTSGHKDTVGDYEEQFSNKEIAAFPCESRSLSLMSA